jgi:hypothetical protein
MPAAAQQLELLPTEPADLVAEIIARATPSDPAVLLDEMVWALKMAMRRRANGVRHLKTCLEANVNALARPCSKDCERAQVALASAQVWLARHRRGAPGPARERMTG